jgi:hypothetical protein
VANLPPDAIDMPAGLDRLGRLTERCGRLMLGLGNLESRWYRDRIEAVAIDRPTYVTGLARAGSTIVLELLSAHPDTATHRYRDFPPVQVPLWWNRFLDLLPRRPAPAAERAHKDGLVVSAESPEAFEEVLWAAFFPQVHDVSQSAVLGRGERHPAFERFYRDHLRKMLLLRRGKRYLAKNNYAVTRLAYLHALFPDARFVIPVRAPEAHVASLVKQHRLFCREECRDARILAHMRRLRHYEFGLDRRPIHIGDAEAVGAAQRLWDAGEDARGYAVQWSSVYGHVLGQLANNARLAAASLIVRYEDLCDDPEVALATILDHCGLDASRVDLAALAGRLHRPDYYRPRFTDSERAAIASETATVAASLGYAAQESEPAARSSG